MVHVEVWVGELELPVLHRISARLDRRVEVLNGWPAALRIGCQVGALEHRSLTGVPRRHVLVLPVNAAILRLASMVLSQFPIWQVCPGPYASPPPWPYRARSLSYRPTGQSR